MHIHGQPVEHDSGPTTARPEPHRPPDRDRESQRRNAERVRVNSCRVWAAWLLTDRVDTFEFLLRRRSVRAGSLDAFVLRHALRGQRLPSAGRYLLVTDEMLDGVAEAAPVITARASELWLERRKRVLS